MLDEDVQPKVSAASVRSAADGIASHLKSNELPYGLAVVVAVTTAAVALTTQGWRSRIPTFDLLTYIHSVHALLDRGALPEFGDIGSYGSFSPPGTAWLMVPSTVLFDDPRVSEYVGTAFLHAATLLGLFLLGRRYFGAWCGCLAVLLYGLSSSGLFQAGSLWPIGRPDFVVWTVYLAGEWVSRRDAKYLAAALAVWGVGMNVDMALAPVFFVIPALWLLYRPSVRLKPLVIAGALVVVVWFPYLRFEAPRDFADIRSQLFLNPIFPTSFRGTWCNPRLALRTIGTPSGTSVSRTRSLSQRAGDAVDERLLANFPKTRIPGARWAFLLMVLAALLSVSVSEPEPRAPPGVSDRHRRWRPWLVPIAAGAAVCGVVARSLISPGSVARTLATLVAAAAIALLSARLTAITVRWAAAHARLLLPRRECVRRRGPLVVGLALPWFILFVFSEPGRPERFLYLWPLQVFFLAAFATHVLPRLRAPRPAAWFLQGLIVFLLLDNSFLVSRFDAWRAHGWSGRDAAEVQAVDYVSDQVDAAGRRRAAIGYQVFIYPFMANYNVINRQYKAGADFDLLFRYRRGITNSDTCAEGVSPSDEYRIVRTTPQRDTAAPRSYIDVSLDDRFRPLRQFGPYRVFKRGV